MSKSDGIRHLPSKAKAEGQSNILRTMEHAARYNDLAIRVKSKLPREVLYQVEYIQFEGMCGAKATIHFKAKRRLDAIGLIRHLGALPLTIYKARNNRRVVWCAAVGTQPRMQPVSREEIAPFLFSVNQGINYGPNVRLNFMTRVGEMHTMIEVGIEKDPACFILEPNTALLNSLKRWRWERSKGFPQRAAKWGLWGHWMTNKGQEDATCTCYWPMSKVRRELGIDAYGMAVECLIDETSRWEGHNA